MEAGDRGLQVCQGAVVDDDVVGQGQALGAAGLGRQHAPGQVGADAVAGLQAGQLHRLGHIHHQDPV